jgi:cyclic-di-GMP phosphodiesterase TipF (flagellum assembly factor)
LCTIVAPYGKRQNDVNFFVNISDHTLNDEEFLNQFIEFMANNPNLASRLIFEMSQRDVAALSDTVMAQLSRLGELGFRFSMDQVDDLDIDFQALAQAHFSFIKVPIKLLLTLPTDGSDWIHPRNLKAKSTVSEISLVVERIEQEDDVIEVLEYGFDFGQGFLFGTPPPQPRRSQRGSLRAKPLRAKPHRLPATSRWLPHPYPEIQLEFLLSVVPVWARRDRFPRVCPSAEWGCPA